MSETRGRGRPKNTVEGPKRRKNGAASLVREGDRFYIFGQVPGLGRRKGKRADSEGEAWTNWDQLHKDNERFDLSNSIKTIGDLASAWLANYEETHEEISTVSMRAIRVRLHIIGDDALNSIPVGGLRPDHVEDWLRRKIKAGYYRGRSSIRHNYSANSIRDILGDLKQIVGWGISRRVPGLDWNPCEHIDRIKVAESADPKRSLTDEQAMALLAEAAGTHRRFGALLLTCLILGCRPGEACGLRDDRIDFDAGTITLDSAVKRRTGGTPIGLGKTKTKNTRTVTAPTILLDALAAEIKVRDELRHPEWPAQWEGLVFRTSTGRPPGASNLRRDMRAIVADAGLPEDLLDLDPYELRHTCATLLDRAGVPVHDIIDQLGHADDRMFYRHYRHRDEEAVGRKGAAMWETMTDG